MPTKTSHPMSKVTLPKLFRAKWLAALRSGKFKQAKGTLHSTRGGYCCLGVAAVVSGVPADKLLKLDTIDQLADENVITLGCPLARNLSSERGKGLSENRINLVDKLMGMNDKRNPFVKIADYIEEQTRGV